MKIITPGHSPSRKKCERCECVFEYENDDVRTMEDDWFDGEKIYTSYVNCPTCNQYVYVARIEQ